MDEYLKNFTFSVADSEYLRNLGYQSDSITGMYNRSEVEEVKTIRLITPDLD